MGAWVYSQMFPVFRMRVNFRISPIACACSIECFVTLRAFVSFLPYASFEMKFAESSTQFA